MKLNEIKPNERNPRTITKDKLEKLKRSIKDFDKMMSLRPIVVDENNVILGGNMRYNALKALGYKDIPDTWVKKAENLTEEEKRRFIIEDNVGFGEWDWDILANEWEVSDLQDWGLDLPNFEVEEEATAEEDDFSEQTDEIETRCQRGDIWQLGEHRLMCGDSTKAEDVAELMDGAKADLWLTDPPYNVAYEGGTSEKLTIKNDNMDDEKFRAFLLDAFTAAVEVMKMGAAFYIWHADSEGFNFRYAVKNTELLLKQCLIWNKNQLVMGRQDYQWKHEPCLYGWKDGGSHHWYSDRKQTTILNFDKPLRNADHPTMKPVPLFAYIIKNSSKEGDIILDTFGGSGTTIVAAEQLGRKCYMMELDPHYCDVILARWEKLTGKTATKI